MRYNADKVVTGIINFADGEVLKKLPTSGKWIVGTGIGLATGQIQNIIMQLQDNSIVKMLNIVDEEGNFDIDTISEKMKEAAIKYGNVKLSIPLVGNLTFSENDIELLKNYIERE